MKNMILPAAAGIPRKAEDAGVEPSRVSPDFIERAMVLVSELVTNSDLVTNSVGQDSLPAGASVELSMRVEPDCIRLEMRDPEPGCAPGSVRLETVRARPQRQGSGPQVEETSRTQT